MVNKMLIYLFVFLISSLFFFIAKKSNNKKTCLILEIMGLFVLSLLAGLRSNTIGTDVNVYVASIYNICAKGTSISEVLKYFNVETGYVAFTKLFTTLGLSFSTFLFAIEFFILAFSFYGIKRIFKNSYITGFLIFLLLFYNRSLNIVRQSMAISLIIFSIPYLIEKKYFKYLACIVMAYFFHKTAVFFIFAIIFAKYCKNDMKNNILFFIGTVITSVVILFGFDKIINIMASIGLVSTKYTFYLSNFVNSAFSISFIDLFLVTVLIVAYLFYKKVFDKKSPYCNLFYYFLCFDFLCLIVSGKYIATFRLGYYYEIPALMFFLNNISCVFKNNRKNFLGVAIAFAFWYCMYVIGNDGNTVPYLINTLR